MSGVKKCIGCGSSHLIKLEISLNCSACGLLFADQRATLDYSSVYSADEGVYQNHYKVLDHFQTTERLMSELLPFEGKIIDAIKGNDIKQFVDLGCGVGRFLRAVQISGKKVIGYELSKQLVDRLRGHRQDVRHGAVDEFLASDEVADAVSLLEVVEHLPNPGEIVARLLSEKKPKMLFIVVPSWSVRRKFDSQFALHDVPPNHLSWWSVEALKRLMKCEGYSSTVTEVQESRRSLIWAFVRNQNRMSFKVFFTLLQAIFIPPSYWLLGVATQNEN